MERVKNDIEMRLLELGFQESRTGFDCIVAAIILCRESQPKIRMMSIYEDISEMVWITSTSVERCIRYSIERYYKDNEEYPAILTPSKDTGKLNNKEFIVRATKMCEDIFKKYNK